MVWDIHVRVDRHDERLIHVKARWPSLGSIQDVSLACGPGMHLVSVESPCRREMNAFSRPIEGLFRLDDGVLEPEAWLTWSDGGEPGEVAVPLLDLAHQPRHARMRNVFHRRSA